MHFDAKTVQDLSYMISGLSFRHSERILKLIGAQNAGPGEDDNDEEIEHESDQEQQRVFSTLNDVRRKY